MACSGKVTRKLQSNRLQQMHCWVGVRHQRMVKSNLTGPEAAGVTAYPDAQPDDEYVQRAISATGISLGVTYQRSLIRAHFLLNLRRLKWTLCENATFIVLVEATPDSSESYPDADVVVHADFVSPKSFYDAAAFQEGILEAFRLFGRNLVGFAALLILNDSIVGAWVGLNAALDASAADTPTLIGLAVWQDVCVSRSGLIFNRAALESRTFEEYWHFVRFPCGKWSAMLLYEGSMVQCVLRRTCAALHSPQ